MQSQLERKTIIFVVRIWKENLRADSPHLRGEIELVNGKEKHYFSTMHQLQEILNSICLPVEDEDGTSKNI
ncbi:MAG: hypothetical protein RBT01_13105 [Anaerolineaceae bacterium]|jgi:hypothetical protein|nr:hypothetical protein [Anaerolineaceae bacterium]